MDVCRRHNRLTNMTLSVPSDIAPRDKAKSRIMSTQRLQQLDVNQRLQSLQGAFGRVDIAYTATFLWDRTMAIMRVKSGTKRRFKVHHAHHLADK